ncbi:flavin-dependent monooxygenase, partial [Mesorhizobium sp. M00.F.Ca.ET.216.01.1.1]
MQEATQTASIVDSQNDYPEYAGPLSLDTLIDEVERRRDEFDAISHVPRDMVGKMKRAGIFRASTPKRFGGDALPPPRFL